MRIAILLVSFFAVACANAADSSGAYVVLGEGVSSCANYLKASVHQKPFFHQWLAGYITAKNQATVARKDLTQANPDQLLDWISRYCKANKNDQFSTAAAALVENAERYGALTPHNSIPVLTEKDDGSFVPLLDETTGLPLFELDGENWTILGPVKTAQKQMVRSHSQESGLLGGTLLGPVNTNAYGPALHSDATGRPFTYRTRDGQQTFGPVTPNGYGPGVHMDQYGRPVYAVPK